MNRSAIRLRWLALLGRAELGRNIRCGRHLHARVTRGARLVIGDDVTLGEDCRLVVHDGTLRIGAGTVIADRCLLDVHTAVTLERDVRVGDAVAVTDRERRDGASEQPLRLQGVRLAAVTVGEGAIIDHRAVLRPGVRVGARARVGAYAVVERDVPAGALAGAALGLSAAATPSDASRRAADGPRRDPPA